MENKFKILIVEDEAIIAMDMKNILQKNGFDVIGIEDKGVDVIEKVKNNMPDLIVMDIKIKSSLDGIDTANIISKDKKVPFLFLTSLKDPLTLGRIDESEYFYFLSKPFDADKFNITIHDILKEKYPGQYTFQLF